MRKRAILIGIVGIILIICYLTIKNGDKTIVSKMIISEYDGIQLDVKTIDYEKKSLTVFLSNETDEIIWYYPYEWEMEKKKKDAWYTMKKLDNNGICEVPSIFAIPLESKEKREITFNWGEFYGMISPGAYRLYFYLLEEGEIGGDKTYIGVEFTLEK